MSAALAVQRPARRAHQPSAVRALPRLTAALLAGLATAAWTVAAPARAQEEPTRVAVRSRDSTADLARRLRERLAGLGLAVEPAAWDAPTPPRVSVEAWAEEGQGRVCRVGGPCDEVRAPTEAELLVDLVEVVRARARDVGAEGSEARGEARTDADVAPTDAVNDAPSDAGVEDAPSDTGGDSIEPSREAPAPEAAGVEGGGVELRLGLLAASAIATEELWPDVGIGGWLSVLPLAWLELSLRLDGAVYAHRTSDASMERLAVQSLALGVGFVPLREGPWELAVRLEGGASRLVDHGIGAVGGGALTERFLPLAALVARGVVLVGAGFGIGLEVGARATLETETETGRYGPILVDLRLVVMRGGES